MYWIPGVAKRSSYCQLPSASIRVLPATMSPTMISTGEPGLPDPVIWITSPTMACVGEATQEGRNGVLVGDGVTVAVSVGVRVGVVVAVLVVVGVGVSVGVGTTATADAAATTGPPDVTACTATV